MKFGELMDNLSNGYLLGDNHYPNNSEVLVILLNNWKGYKKQQPTTMNTSTVQDKVVSVQKDAYINNMNGKRVNAAREYQFQHCRKKDWPWIDECPDISP